MTKKWLAKRECAICGFEFHKHDLYENWKGQLVCRKDYEPPANDKDDTIRRNS